VLSALVEFRFRALLRSAMRLVATRYAMPISSSGRTAMIGARKMTSSRIKISTKVAAPTMASALLVDC
jgi:hypothetical protein